mgnify:CR=1 FL=1
MENNKIIESELKELMPEYSEVLTALFETPFSYRNDAYILYALVGILRSIQSIESMLTEISRNKSKSDTQSKYDTSKLVEAELNKKIKASANK